MELHKYANDLFIIGNYEMAIQYYDKLIEITYKLDIIYSNKAACFLKLKNYKSALECALNSVQINLNHSIAWGRIGYAYKGLKMFTESLNAFEIAHKLDKYNENYIKELSFLNERFNKKINMTNVFNLLLNNKNIFNKLKNIKNEIIKCNNTNFFDNNNTNFLDNENITSIINEIMNEL